MKPLNCRHNYLNVKRFIIWKSQTGRVSEESLSRYERYLQNPIIWAGETPFNRAHLINPGLVNYMCEAKSRKTKKVFSPETIKKTINLTRDLLIWGKEKSFYPDLPLAWINSLNTPTEVLNSRIALEHKYVSLEEVRKLMTVQVRSTDYATLRDKAAAALAFCSGIRGGALTTLPIEAVALDDLCLYQYPVEYGVKTKNKKKGKTFLYDFPDLLEVIRAWDDVARVALSPTDPWYFPVTQHWGKQTLEPREPGKHRVSSLDRRLKRLYGLAEIPELAKSSHKFRHGFAVYGLQHAQSMEEYKAISQNLMHADISTTDSIYAEPSLARRKNIVTGMGSRPVTEMPNQDLIHAIVNQVSASFDEKLESLARKMAAG
jgi:integrase